MKHLNIERHTDTEEVLEEPLEVGPRRLAEEDSEDPKWCLVFDIRVDLSRGTRSQASAALDALRMAIDAAVIEAVAELPDESDGQVEGRLTWSQANFLELDHSDVPF